jgi:hypothetical protein
MISKEDSLLRASFGRRGKLTNAEAALRGEEGRLGLAAAGCLATLA